MAYNPINKSPNDFRPNNAIGVQLFSNATSIFGSTFQTKDAAKANLINFLLTNKGEILGNPEFGASLQDYLFTQSDSADINDIKVGIQSKINAYFSNIKIEDITITQSSTNSNSIDIAIKFQIINTNITDTININLS